jgi:hypothetical protein
MIEADAAEHAARSDSPKSRKLLEHVLQIVLADGHGRRI